MEFIKTAISSSVASTLLYPVELIKSQYQVTRLENKQLNLQDLIKNLKKNRGFFGFYRGINAQLITDPIFWGCYFQTRNNLNNLNNFNNTNKYLDNFSKSFFASIIASVIANPLFVIKVKMHTENLKYDNKIKYHELVKRILQLEGIKGFYRGLPTTIFNNTKLGIQLPLFDKIYESTKNIPISAGLARCVAVSVYYPTDLIKTIQRHSNKKMPVLLISKSILKNEGFMGFYRGIGIYNLFTCPNFMIMMLIKENLKILD